MINYQSIASSSDFLKFLKELYVGKSGKVNELELPEINYLTFTGKGKPADPLYSAGIGAIYSVAYTLKMGLKFKKISAPKDYFDYKVPALETLWWTPGTEGFDMEKANWKILLAVPAFISQDLLKTAKTQAAEKKKELPIEQVKLEAVAEGKVAQTLHIGSYSKEEPTIKFLLNYLKENKYQIAGHHHEIYLSDPRRLAEDKWKTIIRYPFK